MIKLFVESLGCPKNTVDTELMIGYLKYSTKVELTDDIKKADVILINTCGFITPAKEESVDEILNAVEIKKLYKDKKIIVSGCLYERYKEELKKELPEVDEFIGVYELETVTQKVLSKPFFHPTPYILRHIITPAHIGYLKIAEGCSNGCSFCSIPLIKGGFKSRKEDDIVKEAEFLSRKGVKELYLIAQDTTAYMLETGEKNGLVKLLEKLENVEGIKWIRIMYTYPTYISEQLLDFIKSSNKVLKYIDVPLQHISDRVLKSMNRKYSKKEAVELIEKLKKTGITIRSTFIVGYPNETREDFDELCDFLEEYELDWAGFFKYYSEENTPAFKLKDMDEKIKLERLNEIEEIQAQIYEKKHKDLIGNRVELIIDGKSQEMPGFLEARMKRSAYEIDGIVFIPESGIKTGKIIEATITQTINTTDLIAKPLKT